MVTVEIRGLAKTFSAENAPKHVLHGIDLTISKSEVVAIRGDNGCGKTTLLNIIAGIETPTEGTVSFRSLEDEKLRIGFTQQDYTSSLLPWFDVAENIALPLRLQGAAAPERKRRSQQILESLAFNTLLSTAYPHRLSGGQKQRIAVARSLIHEPHLLLLDEPFANLDAHTSRDLQEAFSRIHYQRRPTILYVSHELDHCIYLADRVILLHGSPARIEHEFAIPLPRPRTRDMVLKSTFSEVRAEILAAEETLYAKQL